MEKLISMLTISTMLWLVGCGDTSPSTDTTLNQNTQTNTSTVITTTVSSSVDFPSFDYTKDLDTSVVLPTNENAVITSSGTYEFSGDYSDKTITVNVDKDTDKGIVYLILNNASFNTSTQTPINIIEAKDVVILLADGSTNKIYQGNIITDDPDFPGGALYSKADTVITGNGSLDIETLYNDGINCRDDLIIDGCSIKITSVDNGIIGKDLLAVSNSNITITTQNDGMKTSNSTDLDRGNFIISSGTFNINAGGDTLSCENTLEINGGDFTLVSGGGFEKVLNYITVGEGRGNAVLPTDLLETSMKAVKSYDIIINGGNFNVSSYEDAFNAKNDIYLNGGTFSILTGDDGMTADNIFTITDCDLTIVDGYEGLEAPYMTITGGTININVLDDAINANGDVGLLHISGGDISIYCQGDGLDSNHDFLFEGGNLVIDCDAIYTGGDSAVDVSGSVTHTGGTIVDGNGNVIDPTAQQMGGRPSTNTRFETEQNTMPDNMTRPEMEQNIIPDNMTRPEMEQNIMPDGVIPNDFNSTQQNQQGGRR